MDSEVFFALVGQVKAPLFKRRPFATPCRTTVLTDVMDAFADFPRCGNVRYTCKAPQQALKYGDNLVKFGRHADGEDVQFGEFGRWRTGRRWREEGTFGVGTAAPRHAPLDTSRRTQLVLTLDFALHFAVLCGEVILPPQLVGNELLRGQWRHLSTGQ